MLGQHRSSETCVSFFFALPAPCDTSFLPNLPSIPDILTVSVFFPFCGRVFPAWYALYACFPG